METKADDDEEQSQDAPAPEDNQPAPSRVPAQPSKGKQRALVHTPATTSNGKGKRAQKEPCDRTDKKLTYLINYLSSAKDPKGRPWDNNEGIKGIRRIAGGAHVCASELTAAAHIIFQLVQVRVTDPEAPDGLAGKAVPQNAITLFLNSCNNWVGLCKKLSGLLEAFGENKAVKKYLKSTEKHYVGVKSLLNNVMRITSWVATTDDRALPKKRRRLMPPHEEREAGPSNLNEDYNAPGRYEELSDEEEEEEEEEGFE